MWAGPREPTYLIREVNPHPSITWARRVELRKVFSLTSLRNVDIQQLFGKFQAILVHEGLLLKRFRLDKRPQKSPTFPNGSSASIRSSCLVCYVCNYSHSRLRMFLSWDADCHHCGGHCLGSVHASSGSDRANHGPHYGCVRVLVLHWGCHLCLRCLPGPRVLPMLGQTYLHYWLPFQWKWN